MPEIDAAQKGEPIPSATVNPETYKITCGYDDCGFTEALAPWAIAHGNEELTWVCTKCKRINLLHQWW